MGESKELAWVPCVCGVIKSFAGEIDVCPGIRMVRDWECDVARADLQVFEDNDEMRVVCFSLIAV